MASTQSPKASRPRHARKSLAHVPSTDVGGDKENLTVDSAALGSLSAQEKQAAKKKIRSRSIGPGGLDALKEDAGNRREVGLDQAHCTTHKLMAEFMQPASQPTFKSILKPAIALSPLKAIPPRDAAHNTSPGKAKGLSTPEKSPRKPPNTRSAEKANSNLQELANPSGASPKIRAGISQSPSRSPTRVAVRTEEEQQAAAKERERKERLAQKDARRKSLGECYCTCIR